MALVGKGGLDRRQYLELPTSTLFDVPVYKTYGGPDCFGNIQTGRIRGTLGYKDIQLTLAAADDLRVPMPLASLLRDRLLTLLAQGDDTLDWSAIRPPGGEGCRLGRGLNASRATCYVCVP